MERRLAVILAADVVGFSALMERDEAGTFERLKAGRKELFEPEIERHHGRIFKLMGDGLLAEFISVVDAVECAVSLQRGLAERNSVLTSDQHIEVRIGINLGEVIVEGEDRYGEGVNIAARLQQIAEPGGICVSGKVAKEVEKKLAFGFEPMGEQRVKNIVEPVSVYRMNLDRAARSHFRKPSPRSVKMRLIAAGLVAFVLISVGAAYRFMQWRDQTEGPALPQKPSIAVLSFANLSDDPQQAYFADGIAEDLMTDLSRLSGLFVVSRNSAFSYKGKNVDLRQVARELGVRYIVEGSVRRSDDRVRINVQLIDATTGGHQWAERYDGSQADLFALQDKVTKAVVAALALQLTTGEQVALNKHETSVPDAYDAFLRGWEHYQRTTPADFAKAIPFFERAIELDPDYGRAQAALAMVYFRSYDQGWAGSLGMSGENVFRKARDYLNLAKARPTSTSHQVAGNISRDRGWYDDAIKEFEAAIALDPSNSWSYAYLAYALIWADRPAEAMKQIETAMRLDPHYPPIFVFYQGVSQFVIEKYDEAAKTLEKAAALNPDDPWPQLFLAAAYGKGGRIDDAAAVVAAHNAVRVKQGGLPLVTAELQRLEKPLKVPKSSNLLDGLIRAGVPYNYDTPAFKQQKLSPKEMDALIVGHRLHGRTLEDGLEHGLSVTADGNAQLYGDWATGSGTARMERDRFCVVQPTTSTCFVVFRNPGGTRAMENEFFWFDAWAYPFSQVE